MRQKEPLREGRRRHAHEQKLMNDLGIENFETVEQCAGRQAKMIKSLETHLRDKGNVRYLRACTSDICDRELCCEACHFASRQYRINMITQAARIVGQFSDKNHQVTLVHPKWQCPVDGLADTNVAAAHQWVRRKLGSLGRDVLAIGSFEVSLSVEQDGSRHWAGEMTLVVAGSSKKELRKALSPKKPKTPATTKARRSCPVMVKTAKHLGRQLGYSLKRFVERRIAYIDKQGRQNRRHVPLRKDEQLEYDSWLTTLPIGERTFCFNCRRNGQTLKPLI